MLVTTVAFSIATLGVSAQQNHICLVAQSAIATANAGVPTPVTMASDYRFTATMTYGPSQTAATFWLGDSWDPQWYTASCVVSATASPVLNPTYWVDAQNPECIRLGPTVTNPAAGCACTKAAVFGK